MPFIPERPKKDSTADKYVKLVAGIPVTVQILDEKATLHFRHWVKTADKPNGFPVPCLGYNSCPICLRNRSLGENASKHPDYLPYQKRYLVNVINLTFAKVSPKTEEIFYGIPNSKGELTYPSTDKDGNSLVDVKEQPVNKVQILERGPDLFEKKFGPLEGRVKNASRTVLAINEFPVELVLEGTGRDTNITVFPLPGDDRTVNPADYLDKKFDLSEGVRFTAEEIYEILSGTTITDILAARNAEKQLSDSDSDVGF